MTTKVPLGKRELGELRDIWIESDPAVKGAHSVVAAAKHALERALAEPIPSPLDFVNSVLEARRQLEIAENGLKVARDRANYTFDAHVEPLGD